MIDSIAKRPRVVIYVDLLQLLRKLHIEIKLKNVDDYKGVTSVLICFDSSSPLEPGTRPPPASTY